MGQINTNINSLEALTALNQNQAALSTSLERLSTGLKINSGKDDPAGLIASQSLQAEINGINQAIDNSQQAGNVLNTADGALNETSSLLLQLQALNNQAANSGALSPAELAANQLQVDSILDSINRISNTTSFNGIQLLNGSLDYTTSSVNTTDLSNIVVNAAQIPQNGNVDVTVQVVASAKLGTLTYASSGIGTTPTTIEVSGSVGTEQLSFAASAHNSAIATAINQVKTSTGVSAVVLANGHLSINSTAYGSAQFVSVQTISGTFVNGKDAGADAIVNINGNEADVQGTQASVRSGNLDISLDLSSAFAQNTSAAGGSTNFYITGGGAKFQLGSDVTAPSQVGIGISAVGTGDLGNSIDGYLSTIASGGTNSLESGNTIQAQKIIDDAISQVATLRGRLGAFQSDVLDANTNSLSVALENVTASESDIEDADFAQETANLTRAQILVQANTSVLAQANSAPEAILKLLS
jgi:flagellin